MRKSLILLAILLALSPAASAQTGISSEARDSLLAEADSLTMLSDKLFEAEQYEEGIRLGTEALNIREKAVGKEDSTYARLLSRITGYCYNAGYYSSGIRFGMEALAITERVVGKESWTYTSCLQDLANLNGAAGNYEDALRFGMEVLSVRAQLYGKENAGYAFSLGNLGAIKCLMGNYTGAADMCREAVDILERVVGKENADYPTFLQNYAYITYLLGDCDEAIRLGTEALEIRERVVGKEHTDYAFSLYNLSLYNRQQGNYEEAIRLGSEALQIREKVLGKQHPDYAFALDNLAICLCLLGNYSEAIRISTEVLNIRRETLGEEHPDYATSLNNLANFNSSLGNYSEAIRLGTEALNIREKVLGKEHPDYATSLNNLVNYNFNIRDGRLTNYHTTECFSLTSALIKKNFADLTSVQRQMFWEKYRNWYERMVHEYAYGLPSDTLTANGYNAVLLSKGLLLNSDIEFSKLIQESGDSDAVAMYEELRKLRTLISSLQEKPIAERFADVDSLERIAQAREQALIARSKVYGDYTDNLVITWEQVREKLSDKDVVMEFVSFPLNADSTMYVAYVLRNDWDCPRLIPLFEEKQLKKVYPNEYYTTSDVSRLVWQPLEEVLEGVETVYFAPSGELYNIAVESVPSWEDEGSSFVDEGRHYYRLSSTRELALKKDESLWDAAAVYGGLKYGMTAEGLTADSRSLLPESETQNVSTNELYSIADTLLAMRGGSLAEALPGTLEEAEAIDKSLEAEGISSALYTDSIGTEASFKALGGKKTGIMHIATHGFYFTEKEAASMDYSFLLSSDDRSGRYVEDKQLTRSGLLFAGANYVLSGNGEDLPEGVDDGILTAKELTGIDLRGLDLVVLSACQTGLGEITGDGVFGLQRGFKKAGAQTIVMSLWKVDDEATRLFMTKFFENIKLDKNGHPTNKHEAFLAAQRYLREEYEIEQTRTVNDNLTPSQRRRLEREGTTIEVQTITERVKPYADPKFWAAFIMLDGVD